MYDVVVNSGDGLQASAPLDYRLTDIHGGWDVYAIVCQCLADIRSNCHFHFVYLKYNAVCTTQPTTVWAGAASPHNVHCKLPRVRKKREKTSENEIK